MLRKPIYYILNMKQLKLHEEVLDRQQNNLDGKQYSANSLILNKRKNDGRNKDIDNEHNKIEDNQTENIKNG